MKLIWRYVRPWRWFILGVMGIKLAGTGTELLVPYVLEHLLDHVTIIDRNRVLLNEPLVETDAPINLEELFVNTLNNKNASYHE